MRIESSLTHTFFVTVYLCRYTDAQTLGAAFSIWKDRGSSSASCVSLHNSNRNFGCGLYDKIEESVTVTQSYLDSSPVLLPLLSIQARFTSVLDILDNAPDTLCWDFKEILLLLLLFIHTQVLVVLSVMTLKTYQSLSSNLWHNRCGAYFVWSIEETFTQLWRGWREL